MGVGFVLEEIYYRHLLSSLHPESPQRLAAVEGGLKKSGLADGMTKLTPLQSNKLITEYVLKIHSQDHINSIRSCRQTNEAAPAAVAGVLGAVDAVCQGLVKNAFCAVRPPGHHAHNNTAHYDGVCQGQGFCFINNIAVAARYAQQACGCRNVLIIDWDYHHGNGTEWSFYDDPSVMFFSTHALYAYPGTGYPDREGRNDGQGYNLNVPLSCGAGDIELLDAWENQLMPRLSELDFKPDIILISAGFDSRRNDPIGDFDITDKGFFRITKEALRLADSFCNGRLISVLEGGYNLQGLASAATAHVKALAGIP